MRRCNTTIPLLLAVFAAISAVARADHYQNPPANVDFHAKDTVPGYPGWTIIIPAGFDDPWWTSSTRLDIDNTASPTLTKNLWFEITYMPGQVPTPLPSLSLEGGNGALVTTLTDGHEISSNTYGWHWKLFPQPHSEWITFSNTSVFDMTGIQQLDVYTKCTPEPATFVMAGLGLLALVGVACKRHIRRDHR